MKVLGIIAEYNPFHLGHQYHLRRSMEMVDADYAVAVMSGNFTQRGEAAIVDKWIRAEAALRCGFDLVLELPAVYAVQTAERFAYGGIQVLNHTGCVTHLSFGSEIGDIAPLYALAALLENEDPTYKSLLKVYLNQGLSFPAARHQALKEFYLAKEPSTNMDILENILGNPNSILGIEYLKALIRTKSTLQAVTVPRILAEYHSSDLRKGISSATAVRREIFASGISPALLEALPPEMSALLTKAFSSGRGPVQNNCFEDMLLMLLRRSSMEQIRSWPDIGEGLEYRIKECALKASSLEGLMSLLKTKRYVYTRLQRMLIHGLLGLSQDALDMFEQAGGPAYLRILGFKKEAAPLLKAMKASARVPILTKGAHSKKYGPIPQKMFDYDCLATDLYGLALKDPGARVGGRDYTENIIIATQPPSYI